MKHKWIMLLLIMVLLSVMLLPERSWAKPAVPEHTDAFYVNDFAGVIDLKAENYMINYGVKLHQETGAQVVLVTVDSTGGASMEEYARTLFDTWEIGTSDKEKGVLLLLSIKDDNYWVLQGDGLKNSLTDSMLSQLLNESLEPDFARKEYAAGARKTYGALIKSLGGVWTEPLGMHNFVADNAGVLPQVTRLYLNQASNRYKTTTGSGIYFVTVNNPGGKTLQEYTYAKYASLGAGTRDVVVVLDIEGDNYHVLQGRDVDTALTNELIGDILNKSLEPQFAAKKYAAGVTAAANDFYHYFLTRADRSPAAAGEASGVAVEVAATETTEAAADIAVEVPAKNETVSGDGIDRVKEPAPKSKGVVSIILLLSIVALIAVAAAYRYRQSARSAPYRRTEPEHSRRRFRGAGQGGRSNRTGGKSRHG
ncbi:TPM domain-containing protein [Paenibacillus typhae]|uniref:TPM domain-containing protein n=1 Tax=Paenibacillus typhae TaxID=1174501 RepID=UPI001C8F030E|nr:TPM domain-containing protein [Paenibacillus typhae]MBY0011365.1 TPM domain-containing protein [Paenibacillus typhae]